MDIAAGQTMWLTNGKVVDVVSGEVHVGRNIEMSDGAIRFVRP